MNFGKTKGPVQGLHRVAIKKRRLLAIGVLTVLLPLSIMLGLQYWWLGQLRNTSNTARQATQEQFLSLLSRKVDYFYGRMAENLLNVPAKLVVGDRGKLGEHLAERFVTFRKSNYGKKKEQTPATEEQMVLASGDASSGDTMMREPEMSEESSDEAGASYRESQGWSAKKKKDWEDLSASILSIFATSFKGPNAGTFLFQDHHAGVGTPEHPNAELDATIRWACRFWEQKALKANPLDLGDFLVDQRDSRFPMILNLIANDAGKVVGIAGVVVSPEYFQSEMLPRRVNDLVSLLEGQEDWRVWIYDDQEELVLTQGSGSFDKSNHTEIMNKSLPFVFSNWTASLSGHPSHLEQLAGTNFWLNITLSAILALAVLSGIALALRTAAHEMQLSEMKSDFVSNVSHELRTPLASIRVFGELLRHGRAKDPEKVKEYGAYIENEGRRLSRLINNILDFSKIESGQKIYRFEITRLEDVVSDLVATLRVRLQGEGVPIHYHEPEKALPMMALDTDALGQVLFNLLDNGIKYGKENNQLDVTVSQKDGNAVVAIRDRGIGIAKAELDKIFERFHRVSTGLVHDVKGSGLGLSIVQHVVEAHKGKVKVSSQEGKGSTFTLILPLDGVKPGECELDH